VTYRSDGEKRRSFVVFEDEVDFVSSKPKELATELEATGKVPPAVRSKNATLWECRTLMPRGIGEQTASSESVQQKSKFHALESVAAIRARAKGMPNSNSYFTARLVCACNRRAYTSLKLSLVFRIETPRLISEYSTSQIEWHSSLFLTRVTGVVSDSSSERAGFRISASSPESQHCLSFVTPL